MWASLDELDLDDLGCITATLADRTIRVNPEVRSAYLGAISSNSLLTTSGSLGNCATTARRAERSPRLASVIIFSTRLEISLALASVVLTRS